MLDKDEGPAPALPPRGIAPSASASSHAGTSGDGEEDGERTLVVRKVRHLSITRLQLLHDSVRAQLLLVILFLCFHWLRGSLNFVDSCCIARCTCTKYTFSSSITSFTHPSLFLTFLYQAKQYHGTVRWNSGKNLFCFGLLFYAYMLGKFLLNFFTSSWHGFLFKI